MILITVLNKYLEMLVVKLNERLLLKFKKTFVKLLLGKY